ncbi:hypothetical protein HDU76_005135 [Blyttiomyces sp. JEL0837]|nr:hypothetical protein HDU76_005135 [Blyttiomyces sp. JEL0837]
MNKPTTGKKISDYILRVRAGPGNDPSTHQTVNVNDELNPLLIDSEHFTGYIIVRMLNFNGITPTSHQGPPITNPKSSYFNGRNRRYSIVVQGRFKNNWCGDDIVFGIDMDCKLRTPPGIGLAIKIAKWLDPALDADICCDKPWIFSPLISAMNALAIYHPDADEVHGGVTVGGVGRGADCTVLPGDVIADDDLVIEDDDKSHSKKQRGSIFGGMKGIKVRKNRVASLPATSRPSGKPSEDPALKSAVKNHVTDEKFSKTSLISLTNNNSTITTTTTTTTTTVTTTTSVNGTSIISPSSSIPISSPTHQQQQHQSSQPEPSIDIGTFSYHSTMVPENTSLLFPKTYPNPPTLPTYEKRKRHFGDQNLRKETEISSNYIYCMDFYDAYFDFSTISVKLPGFSLSGFKYWDGQPLRFVARTRDRSVVFYSVVFELLDRADVGVVNVEDATECGVGLGLGVVGENLIPDDDGIVVQEEFLEAVGVVGEEGLSAIS